jgi:predicted aspartyl protease
MEIPLEILNLHDDGFHLLVDVVIYEKSFKAVIDTGASRTVFDKTLISELALPEALLNTEKLSTGLGTTSMESFLIRIPDLKIGNLLLSPSEYVVIDLSNINNAYETMQLQSVVGVIGGDILMRFKAIIDYNRLILKLFKD